MSEGNGNTGPWLAKPPESCCFKGVMHSGTPRGHFEEYAGLRTYVSHPADKPASADAARRVLLYFTDVYGIYTNALLVMDSFADAGYLVVGADYLRGDSFWKHQDKDGNDLPTWDRKAWVAERIADCNESVPVWTAAIKAAHGGPETKYACVGYCFGAPYVCRALAVGDAAVGAFAHPASLQDSHFRDIKGPLFLACTDVDFTFPPEARRQAIDILRTEKKTWQLQLFTDIDHGFALRGDMDNPYQRYVKEASFSAMLAWLNHWLALA
ncbi:hypothetical protein CDD82_3633 [Ophiocordyceps australis]|uniref:Dienelactone hydrolase domain-containing protein n=1 Tax=Ophiocordyceps australis TaxID=1399860 RepID=A0A2C5ZAZ3_9HYPO|nr:hypothetical protein CDD82_3633 [Ophiocordyceps australis]